MVHYVSFPLCFIGPEVVLVFNLRHEVQSVYACMSEGDPKVTQFMGHPVGQLDKTIKLFCIWDNLMDELINQNWVVYAFYFKHSDEHLITFRR